MINAQTSASVDSGRAKGLPDDGFTDIGSDEERNTRSETVALLEKLIQEQHYQTCDKELQKKAGLLSKSRKQDSDTEDYGRSSSELIT